MRTQLGFLSFSHFVRLSSSALSLSLSGDLGFLHIIHIRPHCSLSLHSWRFHLSLRRFLSGFLSPDGDVVETFRSAVPKP
uniref:Secreted protein n=1 Tax=Helianthus annuus TaxID=4232 RepID=A0A251T9X9_HELAN